MWDRSAKIDFPCPNCKHEFVISIGKILDGADIKCPKCKIPIKANDFQRKLKSIEKQIERFSS